MLWSAGWNVLDLLVVAMGLLKFAPGCGNLSGMRAVRVLRPLRTITRIKGMKVNDFLGWMGLDCGCIAAQHAAGHAHTLLSSSPSTHPALPTTVLHAQKLVTALLSALPMLGDVVVLNAFCYCLFGIIGVNVFAGVLDYR